MDNNTDNNNDGAEAFVALVREKVQSNMSRFKMETLTELLTSLTCHVILRDLYVANGIEMDDKLKQMADAAVYFLKEAGLNTDIDWRGES